MEDIQNMPELSSYMSYITEFHQGMQKNNLILVYEGEVTQEVTKAFTALAERNLEKSDESGKVTKKVYHVMVECLQNISKHANDTSSVGSNSLEKGLVKNGIFVVGRNEGSYFVTSGNPIDKDNIESLKNMIDHINSLDKDEIKALYKEKLKASRLSETGGAGLGFIDMVKKTGNKLAYCFKKIDNDNYFFLLRTLVTRQ
tara:strand:+ start:1318 stop:1917 length:600 start_codon:yes stop_codon:yes gene_type:complete